MLLSHSFRPVTWQIAAVFILILAALIMFVREKTSPDLIALGVLVIIAALGLVPTGDVLAVFGNPAPITVAARAAKRGQALGFGVGELGQ